VSAFRMWKLHPTICLHKSFFQSARHDLRHVSDVHHYEIE